MEHLKKEFQKYLIEQGYSLYTPKGYPSTVFQYLNCIDKVCEWEGYSTWDRLADEIPYVVQRYDTGGPKEIYGNKSHRQVISALVQFKNFICD